MYFRHYHFGILCSGLTSVFTSYATEKKQIPIFPTNSFAPQINSYLDTVFILSWNLKTDVSSTLISKLKPKKKTLNPQKRDVHFS